MYCFHADRLVAGTLLGSHLLVLFHDEHRHPLLATAIARITA
jgi:hypothetical protein